MSALLLPLSGAERLADELARRGAGERGELAMSRFADGESRVRLLSEVEDRDVVLCACLREPDALLVPLLLAADAARELGAKRVLLAAPYLPYMRQDARFRRGEAVSARTIGRLLSAALDGLLTVDPHLHRIHALEEIYSLPSVTLRSAPLLAAWIREEVRRPLVVGPDAESSQWTAEVARAAGCPEVVLRKLRHDDHRVEIEGEGLAGHAGRTPVIVDDLIATAGTSCETLRRLAEAGLEGAVVLAVHGLFVGDAEARLRAAGAARIVTTDSLGHPTNAIALGDLIAEGLAGLLGAPPLQSSSGP